MLVEVYEYDQIAKNINFSNISSFLNGKKAYISETMLKGFFNIIDKDTIELKLDGENFKSVSIVREDFPLEFSLQKEKDKLVLKQTGCLPCTITKEYFFL